MHFKKLDVFGFKSFADKTVLNFGPGITAIIGPNGCGKSNVFDAVRWVLGEQSSKELRGASMEDVIFNGTDQKPALGFAEVSLTFSNEDKQLPIDYNEVTVTRRLFRSGESEYLLNRTQVRLKDIAEIFMGTGIGAEAYSLVQQGKVDLVVSAKPEDRRMILDEASGITKYKAKKREAINKLKDTEGNLLRINDIVTEVKRQISSLERQANKARKYKEEFEQLKTQEILLARFELKELQQKREKMQEEFLALKGKEEQLLSEIKEYTDRLEHESQYLEELEEKVNETNAQGIKLDGEIDIHNRQMGFNEERIENLRGNQQRIKESQKQIQERSQKQQARIDEAQQALAQIEAERKNDLDQIQEKKSALEEIVASLKMAESMIRSEEEKILEITSHQVNVKNRLTEAMKDMQGNLARQRRLEQEQEKVLQEKVQVDGKFNEVLAKVRSVRLKIEAIKNEIASEQGRLKSLDEDSQKLEKGIGDLERRKLFLTSQKEFIEKLSAQYQDIPDPLVLGRLFTVNPPAEHHNGIIGKVKEVLPVGPLKSAALLSHFFASEKIYEVVCEAKFVELDPQQLAQQIEAVIQEIEKQSLLMAQKQEQIRVQSEMIALLESDFHELEKSCSVSEAQQGDVDHELLKLRDELKLVHSEIEEVRGNLGNLKRTEDELSRRLDCSNQELRFCQIKIKEQQDAMDANDKIRESLNIAIAQIQTELDAVEERKSSLQESIAMFDQELEGCRQQSQQFEAELQGQDAKAEEYRRDIEEIQNEIEQLKSDKEGLQSVLLDQEKQKAEVAQRIQSLRSNLNAYDRDLDEMRNFSHRQDLEEQELNFKAKEIRDRLWQTYKIDMDQPTAPSAQGETISEAQAQPLSVDELQISIERLRKRCESFGAVNLVAIEEFEDLRERFEFLTKQQSDLIEAKESLHQTISKINRQTRQMFMDTFIKVSEEFRIYFRMLFGGGEAELVLLDPENVLECGIEIVARPPGKKLQSISLLSGGEKTLTAIALIFGVFKVNPSPFCVLDEIDAALDEANVGRFVYLLKDFAKTSQFIVITHNKKTMANADVLYGITMQETGISKLVSVKFDEAPQEKDQEKEEEVSEAVSV